MRDQVESTITDVSSDWLSVPDIARELRAGRRPFYAAIRARELRATKINGRDLRVHRSWLRDFLERRAVRAS